MVRRRRSGAAEVCTALAMRAEVAFPAVDVLAGEFAKATQSVSELLVLRIDDCIRPVGGNHAPLPSRPADGGMVFEPFVSALGRCQKLDVEPVEQGARAEC